MLNGLHDVLTCSHQPAVDSTLHARYGLAEAYAMWPLALIHSYTLSGLPPWHEPASLPQFSTCCTARLISAPRPRLLILIRSPSAERVACAQHEPQYWGMCWFRIIVRPLDPCCPPNCSPCTSPHVNLVGSWCMARYVCGSGLHSPVQSLVFEPLGRGMYSLLRASAPTANSNTEAEVLIGEAEESRRLLYLGRIDPEKKSGFGHARLSRVCLRS